MITPFSSTIRMLRPVQIALRQNTAWTLIKNVCPAIKIVHPALVLSMVNAYLATSFIFIITLTTIHVCLAQTKNTEAKMIWLAFPATLLARLATALKKLTAFPAIQLIVITTETRVLAINARSFFTVTMKIWNA